MTMRPRAFSLAVPWLIALAGALSAQVADANHQKVYDKAASSVVAIRAEAMGERSGTGVVLSADGLILTSYSVCPRGATKIRVWTRGPKLYADAELVATSQAHELALLRIKPKAPLTPAEFGGSSGVRIGDVSYTLGNAANSIITDDQPSLNAGVVSGAYRLDQERAKSWYTGPVLETTAAVNVGMEGAPFLDAQGKVVGIVILNYSPNRFLGTAIPVDEIKAVIEKLRGAPAPAVAAPPAEEGGEAWLGLKARDAGGRVLVDEVEKGGPADEAGFQKGDVILGMANAPVKAAREIAQRLKALEPGSIVWFTIDSGSGGQKVRVTLEKKK